MTKYLEFDQLEPSFWACKISDVTMGYVEWSELWREYVFIPEIGSVVRIIDLAEIVEFIKTLK